MPAPSAPLMPKAPKGPALPPGLDAVPSAEWSPEDLAAYIGGNEQHAALLSKMLATQKGRIGIGKYSDELTAATMRAEKAKQILKDTEERRKKTQDEAVKVQALQNDPYIQRLLDTGSVVEDPERGTSTWEPGTGTMPTTEKGFDTALGMKKQSESADMVTARQRDRLIAQEGRDNTYRETPEEKATREETAKGKERVVTAAKLRADKAFQEWRAERPDTDSIGYQLMSPDQRKAAQDKADALHTKYESAWKEYEQAATGGGGGGSSYPSWLKDTPEAKAAWDSASEAEKAAQIKKRGP